jgi:methanogen homocitrate synthase
LNECELDVSDDELIEIVRQVKKQREEGKYINDKVFKEIVKNTKK